MHGHFILPRLAPKTPSFYLLVFSPQTPQVSAECTEYVVSN